MDLQRIRIHADVYFLEVAGGAVVRNRLGSLEIMGKGAYQLLGWMFAAFDGSRSYADAVGKLPATVEQHVRAIIGRLLDRRFARTLGTHEAHDEPLRERFPELYNLLEYRTVEPVAAWRRVLDTEVAVSGHGQLQQQLVTTLSSYGLQVADATAPRSHRLAVLVGDSLDDYQRALASLSEPEARSLAGGLCRHGQALYALAAHDQAELAGPGDLAAVAAVAAGGELETMLPPAALSMAAHAICLALFERVALEQVPEGRLLVVDEVALSLSHHRLLPRALLQKQGGWEGQPLQNTDGWLRPDLGGSILPDVQTEALNAIARSLAALSDMRTGPVQRIDDGDLFQMPLAASMAQYSDAQGHARQVLTLGLSARETRNQGMLAALDAWLASRHVTNQVLAFGWSRREAVLRAARTLFDSDHAAFAGATAATWDWSQMPQALHYLSELFDGLTDTVRCVRNACGWYMAQHPALAGRYGVGVLPAQAVGDLLLKMAAQRWYAAAAHAHASAVLLQLDTEDSVLEAALQAALTQLQAREYTLSWQLPASGTCPLFLVGVGAR